MNDTSSVPDHAGLFDTASEQAGHFTTAQALAHGFSSALLTHHARTGRFQRVDRGVYRLRDFPFTPNEPVVAAWLRRPAGAVVSHESALELLGLSDVIANHVHLTVPRAQRHLVAEPWVRIHTTTRPFSPGDVIERYGVRLTSPARTVVDVAESGVEPEQVVQAVREALERAMTTPTLLMEAAHERPARVRRLIGLALGERAP